MASNKIEVDSSLIDQLCCIASVSRIVAANLLEACDNNLEMAINMQMEGGIAESNGTSSSVLDDDIRAPIPQRQEVLVDGPDQFSYSFRGRSRITHSVFDKFRDFEAETKRQEEELLEESSSSSNDSLTQKRRKMKTLEDLFRPPLDLMFRGSFQSAREAGIGCRKWLIVNVQNSSEFPCQVLNRDVWSNAAVKTIIQEHFIFWQIYHDSEDGLRYMNFYPVNEWPYIAIIDPRTGEKLVQWQKMDAVAFCDLITEFLSSHPPLDEGCSSSSAATHTPPRKKLKLNDSIIEADEQSQIEAAIKASLESTAPASNAATNGDSDDLETFESDSEDLKTISKTIESDSKDLKTISSKNKTTQFRNETEIEQDETTCTSQISNLSSEGGSSCSVVKDNAESEGGSIGSCSVTEDKESESVRSEEGSSSVVEDRKESDDDVNDKSADEVEFLEEKERWKLYLGNESDAQSNLILRLPDASREVLKMPSTSKLMALVLYVASKGFSNESYELVTNFPRRHLSSLDFNMSLKAAGLFPQETVFIQKR